MDNIRDLVEAMRNYWPIVAGVALVSGYVIGRVHAALKADDDPYGGISIQEREETGTDVAHDAQESGDHYEQKTIKEALNSEEDVLIEGKIKEWYKTQQGYSGIIVDSSGEAPFYMDISAIDSWGDDGLVSILLRDALKKIGTVKMRVVGYEEKPLLLVGWFNYRMNDIDYEI